MKLSRIKRSAATEGTWVEPADIPGIEVCIVPADDLGYRRANTNALQPHYKQVRANRLLDPAVNDAIVAKSVAEGMLKGWRKLEDEDGAEIPYSKEKALELAEDPENAEFFAAILREGEALAEKLASERKVLGKS